MSMSSLKKYFEFKPVPQKLQFDGSASRLLVDMHAAYRSALQAVGSSSLDACPALGTELKRTLAAVDDSLAHNVTADAVQKAESAVRSELLEWGQRAAQHYQKKADEVKQILTVMARTAESVGQRDERCADRLAEVTGSLKKIASLDDLTEIRKSIETSATKLKSVVDQMSTESKEATDQLRTELTMYQARLEEAQQIAASDSLTGLHNRLWMENHIATHMETGGAFCVIVIDIDKFKTVNDTHGHLAGDELLQQFSIELNMAFRARDAVSRWGGDEFLVLLDCNLMEAHRLIGRLRKWACGNYKLTGRFGQVKLNVNASFGVAEYEAGESMKTLITRADAEMYKHKAMQHAGERAA